VTADEIEIFECQNGMWSQKRLNLDHGFDGNRFTFAFDALLEAVLTALAGEFEED